MNTFFQNKKKTKIRHWETLSAKFNVLNYILSLTYLTARAT